MKAPNFSLYDINSDQMVELSDFTNKPVLLTFWVSWCPDCQKDLPQKVQFYESLDKDSLAFLSINVTGREGSPDDGQTFARDHELPFPVLMDEGTKTYDAYGCTSVPTTIILDGDHHMVESLGDQSSFYEIVKALSMVLK